jgi:hypothetical protein
MPWTEEGETKTGMQSNKRAAVSEVVPKRRKRGRELGGTPGSDLPQQVT